MTLESSVESIEDKEETDPSPNFWPADFPTGTCWWSCNTMTPMVYVCIKLYSNFCVHLCLYCRETRLHLTSCCSPHSVKKWHQCIPGNDCFPPLLADVLKEKRKAASVLPLRKSWHPQKSTERPTKFPVESFSFLQVEAGLDGSSSDAELCCRVPK